MTIGAVPIAGGMLAGPAPAAPAAGTTPIVALEVAFTTAPGATPVWVDVSDYLIDFTVNRGRSQEGERFRAGTAEIILANDDRRFDPTNTASPYYPNVLPMRRCRLRSTFEAVTYDVFTGYADGWQQEYDHPQVSRARLTATDAFKVLAAVQLQSSAYATEVVADAPAVWYRLGEPVGSTQFLDSVTTRHLDVTTAEVPTLGTPGLVTRDPDTATDFALGTHQGGTRGPGIPSVTAAPFTFEMIYKGATTPVGSLYGEVNDSGGLKGWVAEINSSFQPQFSVVPVTGGPFLAGIVMTTSTVLDGNPHHLAFTWDVDGTLTAYFDGVAQATSSVAPSSGFPATMYAVVGGGVVPTSGGNAAGGTYDEVAVYPTALSAARIAAHSAARAAPWGGDRSGARVTRILDAAGWPTADREIDTGVAVMQTAELGISALEALQKIEETEQGRLFVTASGKVRFISRESLLVEPYVTPEATFGDSGSELEYGDLKYRYDDTTIANEVIVSRSDGQAVTAEDAASQVKYLRRSRVLSGLLHTSDATSLDLANAILGRYKEPLLRPTQMRLEPDAGNASTHYPQVFGRELVDHVTVRRRPQNLGSAIDQGVYVEAITHRASATHWKTDWNLSPAPAASAAGVWDGGLWDQATWGF